MKNYYQMFQKLVQIMKFDYAGCERKKEWGRADFHKAEIVNKAKANLFWDKVYVQIINRYLSEFKDPELIFHITDKTLKYQPYSRGFSVRRYKESLYVTRINGENRLSKGDKIIELGGIPISSLLKQYRYALYGLTSERELWGGLLLDLPKGTVVHTNGQKEELVFAKYPAVDGCMDNAIEIQKLKDSLFVKINNFFNYEEINSTLLLHKNEILGCNKIILDLRQSRGGYERSFLPLLPLVFEDEQLFALSQKEELLFTNYTENNCRLLEELYLPYLSAAEGEIKEWLKNSVQELKRKSGKGILSEERELPDYSNVDFTNLPRKRTVILTDVTCKGTAEDFVLLAKKSPLVTVVGRNTMGDLGYENPVTVSISKAFSLTYPVSYADPVSARGKASGVGIEPDIYIPWNPEHIEKDIDLQSVKG